MFRSIGRRPRSKFPCVSTLEQSHVDCLARDYTLEATYLIEISEKPFIFSVGTSHLIYRWGWTKKFLKHEFWKYTKSMKHVWGWFWSNLYAQPLSDLVLQNSKFLESCNTTWNCWKNLSQCLFESNSEHPYYIHCPHWHHRTSGGGWKSMCCNGSITTIFSAGGMNFGSAKCKHTRRKRSTSVCPISPP